jgi:hypothetical protein
MFFPLSHKMERKQEMRKSLFSFTAVAMLFVAGTSVRADSIPWGYSATDTTIFNSNNPIKSSSIKMTGASGVASGNSGIIIYNLTSTSTAGEHAPDSFSSVPFNLAVTLSDIKATATTAAKSASAKSTGVVNFAGLFSASGVTTKSLFPGANSWNSPNTTSVTLGADDVGWREYTVTLSSITPPGEPGGAPGSIQAIIEITPVSGPGGDGETPPSAPEPASLVLAGLGLPLILLVRRRLKKTQNEGNVA